MLSELVSWLFLFYFHSILFIYLSEIVGGQSGCDLSQILVVAFLV